MRIAVIGAGRIGSALIKSLAACGHGDIVATGRREETLKSAEALGIRATRDNQAAVESSDVVFICVKPHHFPEVARAVSREAWRGKVVVSLMAGVRISTVRSAAEGARVYRAMPNMAALVRESSTAAAGDGPDRGLVERLLGCMGRVYWVPEELLDAWTALAGSGPAYLAEIVDALAMAGLLIGLPRDLAYSAVLDVLEGTARLLRESGDHPAALRDEVTTPAGTTIKGLLAIESEGVKAALMKAVEAAFKRSLEIGREIDEATRKGLGVG